MEQLIQTGQINGGTKIGKTNYEFYNLGNETVKTLIDTKIFPNIKNTVNNRKPDQFLVDRKSQKKKYF